MSTKYQIIEPINGISKIVLLQFKNSNTKLSLRGFSIHYDDAKDNQTYLQHVLNRVYRGDSREDIAVLEDMIINYLDWYVINNSDEIMRNMYIQIIKLSLNGFKHLQFRSYKSENMKKSNVKLALQYYINLINIIINDPDTYKNINAFKMLCISDENISELDDETITHSDNIENIKLVNIDGLKKIWKKEEVIKLHLELTSCFDELLNKKNDDFTLAKVKSLMEVLEKKDNQFKEEITKLLGNNQ